MWLVHVSLAALHWTYAGGQTSIRMMPFGTGQCLYQSGPSHCEQYEMLRLQCETNGEDGTWQEAENPATRANHAAWIGGSRSRFGLADAADPAMREMQPIKNASRSSPSITLAVPPGMELQRPVTGHYRAPAQAQPPLHRVERITEAGGREKRHSSPWAPGQNAAKRLSQRKATNARSPRIVSPFPLRRKSTGRRGRG